MYVIVFINDAEELDTIIEDDYVNAKNELSVIRSKSKYNSVILAMSDFKVDGLAKVVKIYKILEKSTNRSAKI